MQEKMPVVIEDVFSVVGCIKHGCIYAPVLQQVDYACQKVIRIADGIVIRVQQVLFILHFSVYRSIRQEKSFVGRIAFAVIEVGTVSVQNNELLGCAFVQL